MMKLAKGPTFQIPLATFDNLSLNEEGLYTLVATDSGGFPAVTSWPFLMGNWKCGRDWACPESRA